MTIFYFDSGAHGLYYASSKDGLTFSGPTALDLSSLSPSFKTAGNDPDVFLDKNGDMILWAGEFIPSIGGYILSVKLTQAPAGGSSTTATTATTTATTATTTATTASKAKSTITCVKGKTVKKVTGTNPKCPAGYKKK